MRFFEGRRTPPHPRRQDFHAHTPDDRPHSFRHPTCSAGRRRVSAVAVIAAEDFVAAVARQDNFHTFTRHPRQVIKRDGRGNCHRLVKIPRDVFDTVQETLIGGKLGVISPQTPRRFFGPGAFVNLFVGKSSREGLHPFRALFRRQRGHQAGIHAARQKRAHLNVCNKMQPHRLS